MSAELDQRRRNVRVLDLLAESYEAYERGDQAAFAAALDQAIKCDAAVVTVIKGGMLIGEIPRPEEDFGAWTEYVAAQHEGLARAEAAR